MKLAATIARSLQADMQAELRDIERAVATGTREAGRGLRTELRRQVGSAGLGQRLANSWRDKHYPNQRLDSAQPGLYQGAADHSRVRRGRGGPEQARALSRDPDRERAKEGKPMANGSAREPSRSAASDRSGSCHDQADRRSSWWTDCAPRTAGKPES